MPKPMRQMSSREKEKMLAILDKLIDADPRAQLKEKPHYTNNVVPVARAKEIGLSEEVFDFFEITEMAETA